MKSTSARNRRSWLKKPYAVVAFILSAGVGRNQNDKNIRADVAIVAE
jgi:hypothetical protein